MCNGSKRTKAERMTDGGGYRVHEIVQCLVWRMMDPVENAEISQCIGD